MLFTLPIFQSEAFEKYRTDMATYLNTHAKADDPDELLLNRAIPVLSEKLGEIHHDIIGRTALLDGKVSRLSETVYQILPKIDKVDRYITHMASFDNSFYYPTLSAREAALVQSENQVGHASSSFGTVCNPSPSDSSPSNSPYADSSHNERYSVDHDNQYKLYNLHNSVISYWHEWTGKGMWSRAPYYPGGP